MVGLGKTNAHMGDLTKVFKRGMCPQCPLLDPPLFVDAYTHTRRRTYTPLPKHKQGQVGATEATIKWGDPTKLRGTPFITRVVIKVKVISRATILYSHKIFMHYMHIHHVFLIKVQLFYSCNLLASLITIC